MHLRAELLGAEEHETKVTSPLGDIEQHFAHVRLRPVARRVLVELVHEDHDGVDAEIATLQVLAQFGDGACEDEVLAEGIHVGDVHDVHGPVLEPSPREVVRRAVVGDETLAAGGDVGEAVADLANGGDVMGAPHVAPPGEFEPVEDRPEQPVQVGERLHPVAAAEAIVELLVEHTVGEEVDERVGFGVDVVAVQQHFREIQHLGEPPDEGLDVPYEIGVRPQRVEVHPVGLEGCVIADALERLRRDAQPLVAAAIRVVERARAIEEAEVRPFYVEAQGGDPALMGREVLEDGREQELNCARLGREPRDTGDVQVRGFGAEQEVGVEIDRRLEASRRVKADGDPRRLRASDVGIHAQRLRHVGVGRDVHGAERHGLERLLRVLPQHRRGPQADLLADRGTLRRLRRVSFGADHVVERGRQIGIRQPVRHDAIDDPFPFLLPRLFPRLCHPYDRPDADSGLVRCPEVELVRRRGLELGGDDAPHRFGIPCLNHDPVLGRRDA